MITEASLSGLLHSLFSHTNLQKNAITVATGLLVSLLPLSAVGYSLIAINGQTLNKKCLPDGRTAMDVLATPSSYPLALKFTRLRASINERIMLLSMFHS